MISLEKLELNVLRVLRAVMELLSILGIVVVVVIFAQTAGVQDIPQGTPPPGSMIDRYGVRVTLTMTFLLAGAIIGLLMIVSRFPRLYKYPVEITARNVEVQYVIAKIMLSGMQFVCAVYFTILMVGIYNLEATIHNAVYQLLTVLFLVACVVIWLFYFFLAKANE